MIPVVTVGQMRTIDKEAIGGETTVGFGYMLKAGMGILETVRSIQPEPADGDIAIVCGKGNNGGDGYVAGGLLIDAGYNVMVFGLFDRDDLRGEALMAYDEYALRKGNFLLLDDVDELGQLSRYSLVIDAILGSGIQGDPRGIAAKAIQAVNACGRPVLAVDTPSGLDNDTGTPANPCIAATCTVAMGFPKIGTLFYPGRRRIGSLVIRDLGYPDDITTKHHGGIFAPTTAALRRMLPARRAAGSKIEHGLVLMVCGSRGMYGSATLACQSALRTGCGMVHAAVPEDAVDVLAAKVTEPVLHPVAQTAQGTMSEAAFDTIAGLAHRMRCAAIGPGLSHQAETTALVRRLVTTLEIPIVLDADGINAFRDHVNELRGHRSPVLLTPHAGEWQRLFGEAPSTPVRRIERLCEVAAQFTVTVLLKGSPTLVATPDGRSVVLPVGNSGMASAGTGDVLTGILASLIAQGVAVEQAAILGACLHGMAGDTAARRVGQHAMIASDMIDALHEPIVDLGGERTGDTFLAG